jgi:hypothetical protein
MKDEDKPFVAATVTFLDKMPKSITGSDDDERLVALFKEQGAIPFAAAVNPHSGFGNALKYKHDKTQVMARVTRLVTGANSKYLDSTGVNLGNLVWSHAMLQAIVHSVRSTMLFSPIHSLQILLDEKTMTKPMRRLFTETLSRMGTSVSKFLRSHAHLDPERMSLYENRIQFSDETTAINWSDDAEEYRSEFGLKIADRLARKVYQQIEGNLEDGIVQKLKTAGFEDFFLDITKVVTRFDQRLVERFKRNTGLPEPRI